MIDPTPDVSHRPFSSQKHFALLILILACIFCLNYIDRSLMAYAIVPIKQEFHLNDTQFGLLGSCFAISYLFFSIIGGLAADHFGSRKALFISCFLWSVIGILTGLAGTFLMLLILRFGLGVAESPGFPSLTRFISDHVSQKKRARILALTLAVVPFSAAIGAPLVTHLILTYNWHIAYILLGSCGLILAPMWWFIYRMPPELVESYKKTKLKRTETWHTLTRLLTHKAILANNITNFAYGYLLFFAMIWLPGFLFQSYGVNLKAIGWLLSMPWLCATVGLISGGLVSDYLFKKTQSLRLSRTYLICLSQFLSLISLLPIIYFHNLTITIICLCLVLGFGFFPNAIAYSLNIDLAKKQAGTSLGLMNSFFALAGILAPFITGWIVNVSGNFKSALYLVMAFTLFGIILLLLWHRPKYMQPS